MNRLVVAVALVAAFLAGGVVGRLWRRPDEVRPDEVPVRSETFTDTLSARSPAPALSVPDSVVTARLPVRRRPERPAVAPPSSAVLSDSSDSSDLCATDSAEVEIPITRNVYEDSLYRAVVSGYMASLDTLEIYSRREVVTVSRPPKRWHIGVSAGFGMTPRGFQPVVAATLTYSLYSF